MEVSPIRLPERSPVKEVTRSGEKPSPTQPSTSKDQVSQDNVRPPVEKTEQELLLDENRSYATTEKGIMFYQSLKRVLLTKKRFG